MDFPRYTRRESHSDPLLAASTQSPITLPNTQTHLIQKSTDFVNKIGSFDVTSLFTCIPISAVRTVRKRLLQDDSLNDRINFTPDNICVLLNLCLSTTYFKYNDCLYRQKPGCAMGSPVSPIVANLYMEEVESKAPSSYKGTTPGDCFRYVDNTWVKTHEVESFTEPIN